jgi:predicted RNA methylase
MDFFSEYPRFFATSRTGAEPERLNRRYHVLIERNADLIRGRRILDIASHDGRWSFAALKAGAAHVTGIETRQHLVSNAIETFTHYSVPDDRYSFLCGDLFEEARNLTGEFDTVFCFGFFYHTLRHAEVLMLVRQWNATAVIIDTAIISSSIHDASIRLQKETAHDEGNGLPLAGAASTEIVVGIPTVGAVIMLLDYFGYSAELVNWSEYLRDNLAGVADYANGQRTTIIGRR